MRQSLHEYLIRFVRSWWTGVGLIGGIAGLVASLFAINVPAWSWRTVVAVAVFVAGFRTFDGVRRERDEARAELAARDAELDAPEPRLFVPRLLEGRLFPSNSYVVVDSIERALVVRVAYALHTTEAILDSDAQRRFEDAVAASSLESWILDETTHVRRASPDHWWRRVKPTSSAVVTVRRPPAPTVAGDHTVEGHAVLNLLPEHTHWPTGWLLLVADVVVRPLNDGAGRALTYQSLYGLAEITLRALVDEIAPDVLESVAPDATPYSLTLLLLPQGLSLSDVVALDWNDWQRAEEMGDVTGGQWFASSAELVRDAALRQDDLRRWFGGLLADSGFSGYERDLETLAPVSPPPPPPT